MLSVESYKSKQYCLAIFCKLLKKTVNKKNQDEYITHGSVG